LLCLALLEFPEMSALEDDTSNDFTILTTDSGRLPAIVELRLTAAGRESRAPIFTEPVESSSESDCGSESVPALPPRDLYSLYSVWRT